MPNPIVGHQTWLGARKETAFGVVAGASTIFPGFETWSPQPKNSKIQRPNGKMRAGQSLSPGGPYDFTASLGLCPDPDTTFPFMAFGWGAQTTPSFAVYATTALTSSSAVGAGTVLAVTAGTGTKFTIGDSIIVGAGTANVETCVITAVAANTVTATTTKTHAAADTVQGLSAVAYSSTLSFGPASLPSFTLEEFRGNDAVDHLGCTIESMKFSGAPGALLKIDLSICAANEAINASPATPSFSNIMPLHIDQAALTSMLYKGAALSSGTILKKYDLGLNNNLEKTYRAIGSRTVAGFPVGQRVASAGFTLSWVDDSAYKDFLGQTAATGPQSLIAGLSIAIPVASASFADPARSVPYGIVFNLPNMYPLSDVVAGKQYGSLEQVFTLDPAETPGLGNDFTATITGTVSTVY